MSNGRCRRRCKVQAWCLVLVLVLVLVQERVQVRVRRRAWASCLFPSQLFPRRKCHHTQRRKAPTQCCCGSLKTISPRFSLSPFLLLLLQLLNSHTFRPPQTFSLHRHHQPSLQHVYWTSFLLAFFGSRFFRFLFASRLDDALFLEIISCKQTFCCFILACNLTPSALGNQHTTCFTSTPSRLTPCGPPW